MSLSDVVTMLAVFMRNYIEPCIFQYVPNCIEEVHPSVWHRASPAALRVLRHFLQPFRSVVRNGRPSGSLYVSAITSSRHLFNAARKESAAPMYGTRHDLFTHTLDRWLSKVSRCRTEAHTFPDFLVPQI